MKAVVTILIAVALAGCAKVNQNNFISTPAEDSKYSVSVTSTSGKTIAGAVVCLDYDASFDYAPAKFRTDATGQVSIPHAYAEKKGWDRIAITADIDGRSLNSVVWRPDVRWPFSVTLK